MADLFKPVLSDAGVDIGRFSDDYIAKAVGMVKGRINFVKDLLSQAGFFFTAPDSYAPKDIKKRWSEDTPRIMGELIEVLRGLPSWKSAEAEPVVLGWITDNGYHMGNVMNAFRLAVVGECKGPHMFDITELMGPDETISRIKKAIETI